MKVLLPYLMLLLSVACTSQTKPPKIATDKQPPPAAQTPASYDTATRTIHVFVALCDNTYQGIVPVPKAIGNGQDPDNNLYWGCSYGIRSFFKASPNWSMLQHYKLSDTIPERLIFRHRRTGWYLVADAYDGRFMARCMSDMLHSASGSMSGAIKVGGTNIGTSGNARLIAFIGHNGLMDARLPNDLQKTDGRTRDAIILACYSQSYFAPYLRSAQARPLLWTTGLMCPEAYTLHDALETYLSNGNADAVRNSAAMAYAKYQHCSIKAAKGLLVTGY